jgi:hypothetical protein
MTRLSNSVIQEEYGSVPGRGMQARLSVKGMRVNPTSRIGVALGPGLALHVADPIHATTNFD